MSRHGDRGRNTSHLTAGSVVADIVGTGRPAHGEEAGPWKASGNHGINL